MSRRFGDRAAVDDVSLRVARGEVTCLLGPSGCGKSTTLRMIAGVEPLDSGEIYVDGQMICDRVHSLPAEERKIGLMFQDFSLFPHLSVADNISFGLKGRRSDKLVRVRELLARVGMTTFENAYPHQLSGGEQQRVALARALAPRPGIMLMDEPFSGLDNRLRDGIRDDTLDILRGEETAVLLVTHEPEEAMRMADQIALMRDGKIVQHGTPKAIYTAPVDRETVGFFSDVNVFDGVAMNAHVDTCFGPIPAADMQDGTRVSVIVRPQHVVISEGDGVAATLTRARFLGDHSLLEFRLNTSGEAVKLITPEVVLPDVGTQFGLRVDPERCFVFAE